MANKKDAVEFVKIEEISIMVLGAPKTEPVQLTSDIIIYNKNTSNPVLTNKLPFITGSFKYNEKYLFNMSVHNFNSLLEFFFNIDTFKKVCNKMYPSEQKIETIKSKYNQNIEKNVEIMLVLLFPTKFPVMRNFSTSYNEYIKKTGPIDISYKIGVTTDEKGLMSTGNNYSYIKLNGTEYTITKILWLNDIFNHPVYRVFIDEYVDYIQKSGERSDILTTVINNSITKLATRFVPTEKNNFDLSIYKDTIDKEYKVIEALPDDELKKLTFDTKKKQYADDMKALYSLFDEFGYGYEGNPSNSISNNINDINRLNAYEKVYTKDEKVQNEIGEYKKNLKIIKDKNKNGGPLTNDEKNELKKDEQRSKDCIEHILTMYTRAYNIKEVYERIKANDRSSLKLTPEFKNKLDNIVSDLRKIVISIKIKKNYITDDRKINTKIEGEEKDVIDELNAKYKYFMDFLKRIEDLNFPKRFSTNDTLQDMIGKYSTGNEILSFSNVLEEITNIIMKNSNKPLNQIEYYNVGVTQINPNDDKLPKYEIYVAFDLIEGKIDDTNINNVDCYYNGSYLGLYAQNWFNKVNTYNAQAYRMNIKKSDYENKAQEETLPTPPNKNSSDDQVKSIQPPPPTETKTGGRRTRRLKRCNKKNKTTVKKNRKNHTRVYKMKQRS